MVYDELMKSVERSATPLLSPPSAPAQRRLQGPPTKSNFLAISSKVTVGTLLLTGLMVMLYPSSTSAAEKDANMGAAIHFGDTVLSHGLDTYGEKQTPLIVDALDVDTMKPPERIQSWTNGEGLQPWISSNLADQGNLQRFMTGLSTLTDNPKYVDAMKAAIQYNFDHHQNESGLLPMGHHRFIELKRDTYHGDLGKGGCPHELKMNFLYYPIFFDVNPAATSRMVQGIWNSHIRNWENLDFNRHAGYGKKLEDDVWDHEYPEDFMGIPEGALSFYDTACDMIVSAGNLTLHTGDKRPLLWAERLLRRYTSNAHPVTKLPPYQHTQSGDRAARQDFPDNVKEYSFLAPYSEGISPPDNIFAYGATALLRLGESLDDQGDFIIRSVHEGMAAWVKYAYHPEENTLHPLACDGTNLTGYVIEKDGYFGKKGRVLKPWQAHPGYLISYALCYRLTEDEAIWTTLRHMLKGNKLGDIGETPDAEPVLNLDTKQDDPEIVFSLIELYKITKDKQYLTLSDVIAKNILQKRYLADKGLFVLNKRLVVANFNTLEPLAFITLEAAKLGRLADVPTYDASGKFAWGRIAVLSGHTQPVPTRTDMRLFRPEDGAVTRWLDQSGHENHARMLATNPPITFIENGIGEKPALAISSGNGLEIAVNENLALKQMSLFMVWQTEGEQKDEAILFGQRPINKSFQLGLYGDNQLFFSTVTGGAYRRVDTDRKQGEAQVELIDVVLDDRTLSLYINGVSMGDIPAPGGMEGIAEAISIGGSGSHAFNGRVAEVILYDRAMSNQERERLRSYLAAKYGIPNSGDAHEAPKLAGCVLWLDASQSVERHGEH
jgi:pectate lyase